MASDIEWTDETWNPTTGCTPVSEGCRNCYAATFAHRGLTVAHRGLTVLRDGRAVFNGTVKLHEERLADPLKWKKPRRVFVDSMSDLFHEAVPFKFVAKVFTTMAQASQHTFQILTKRPRRMAEFFEWNYPADKMSRDEATADWLACWPNVWLGTSIENQQTADERIPHLLKCPAALRFLSYEPALGPVDLEQWIPRAQRDFGHSAIGLAISWVIAGGESGHGARPANIEWFRSMRDQCKAAGVAFFMKQLGADPQDLRIAALESIEEMKPEHLNAHGRTIKNTKGGDMAEFPSDLKIREFPAVTR